MVELNRTGPTALDVLLSRRSGKARDLTGPGPSPAQLADILAAGARVPDHGKLAPWRFILFGDVRTTMTHVGRPIKFGRDATGHGVPAVCIFATFAK